MIVINPVMGGGLSSAKLALATATAADVLAGKTFYAGDEELKTGTNEPYAYLTGSVLMTQNVIIEVPGTIVFSSAAYSGYNRVYTATHTPLMHPYQNWFFSSNAEGAYTFYAKPGTSEIKINGGNAETPYTVYYYVCYQPFI